MVAVRMGILRSGAVSVSVCGCTAGAVCHRRIDRTSPAQGQPSSISGGWKHLSGAGDIQPRVSFQFVVPGPPQHAPPQPC